MVGFRYPAAWSLILLTKVTPGIGLLWFAVRREWRSLAIALGATAVIAAVSLAIDPRAWFEWFGVIGVERRQDERDLGGPADPALVPPADRRRSS